MNAIPIHRPDDNELLGFVAQNDVDWQAQTIFGYTFATAPTYAEAERIVRNKGLDVLTVKWQYRNANGEWYTCLLKEASPSQVTVIRVNEYGYMDPDNYGLAVITDMRDLRQHHA